MTEEEKKEQAVLRREFVGFFPSPT
ncbi:MAG: hypothetical protein V8S12_03940 [Lachnospiraceae bacterium]